MAGNSGNRNSSLMRGFSMTNPRLYQHFSRFQISSVQNIMRESSHLYHYDTSSSGSPRFSWRKQSLQMKLYYPDLASIKEEAEGDEVDGELKKPKKAKPARGSKKGRLDQVQAGMILTQNSVARIGGPSSGGGIILPAQVLPGPGILGSSVTWLHGSPVFTGSSTFCMVPYQPTLYYQLWPVTVVYGGELCVVRIP